MVDEIGEIGDEIEPPILTILVNPITILVTILVTAKLQVIPILINLIKELCVCARRNRDHQARPEQRFAVNVDDVVAERIAAARARIEAAKRRRAALAAARQRGLAHRHAAKLRNLSVGSTDGSPVTTDDGSDTKETS